MQAQVANVQKLLIICGPTSTGKTTLAIRLAKKFNGEILSADSRQVYKGMDVGTGKDLPAGSKLKIPWFKNFGYYEMTGVRVWGYDLADPRRDFSVAQYLRFAERIITEIRRRRRLPIIVGGTGFYIKAIVDGIPTVAVPRSGALRRNLEKNSIGELFEMLARLDPIRAGNMNASDRKNPRRLIRAIEIAASGRKSRVERKPPVFDCLFIGLFAPESTLFDQIEKRVKARVKNGIEKEIKRLTKKRVGWKSQPMTSLGYSEWEEYFSGKKSKEDILNKWKQEEKKYAKRQMVWFKKDKRIVWFDVTDKNFQENVEKKAEKWYKTTNA